MPADQQAVQESGSAAAAGGWGRGGVTGGPVRVAATVQADQQAMQREAAQQESGSAATAGGWGRGGVTGGPVRLAAAGTLSAHSEQSK